MKKINMAFGKNLLTKLLMILIIIAFAMWGIGDFFSSGKKNIVAEVNGEQIYIKEFLEKYNQNRKYNSVLISGKNDEEIFYITLNILISEKLVELVAKEKDIYINNKTLSNFIKMDDKFKENNEFSRIKYEKFLLTNQLSANEYEKRFKKNLLKRLIIDSNSEGLHLTNYHRVSVKNNIFAQVDIEYFKLDLQNLNVDDQKVREYFKQNKRDFELGELRDAKKIELSKKKLNINNNDNESFYQIISEIENKILNNENISSISNDYNLEIEFIEKINNVGFNQKYIMSKDVIHSKLLFELDDNFKTQIYEINNKYYIIELNKIYKNYDLKFNINLIEKIKTKIKKELAVNSANEIIKKTKLNPDHFKNYANDKNFEIKKISLNRIDENILFNKTNRDKIIDMDQDFLSISNKNNIFVIKKISNTILKAKAKKFENKINLEINKKFKNLVLDELDVKFNKDYKIKIIKNTYENLLKNVL